MGLKFLRILKLGQKSLVTKLDFTLEYIVNLWADLSRHFFSTLGQWLNILLSGKISRDNKESDIARGTFLFTGQLNSKTIDSDIDNSYMV